MIIDGRGSARSGIVLSLLSVIVGCSSSDANGGGGALTGAGGGGGLGSGAGGAGATAGAISSGGTVNGGGTTSSGGVANAGGSSNGGVPSGGAAGAAPLTAACGLTAARLRVTEIDVGVAVVNDEDEAALHPLAIASIPSGGSRLAFAGNDGAAHVVTLDASDHVVGTAASFPARDFSDIYADDAGGVLLVSRDAHGAGDQHCGTLTNLCGNVSTLPATQACWDSYLVRFDGAAETWATQLSESAADTPPYLGSPTDSRRVVYLWQAYAHHGRIAFDGSNYAAYHGAAMSLSQKCVQPDTSQPNGVNIHQGDRMTVVTRSGQLAPASAGSFSWGCSHSGYERILWEDRLHEFVSVCKTDNENRIALAPSYSTVQSVALDAANLGDLVTATSAGVWLAASDAEAPGLADVSLIRFGVNGTTVVDPHSYKIANEQGLNERAPHLAAYGANGLLVAWETSSEKDDIRRNDPTRKLHLRVHDRETAAAIGDTVDAPVLGNRYQSFRSFPDGSVAFPAPGSTSTKVKILRVLPCSP